MTVSMDQGRPSVIVLGQRKIKVGNRQATGKRKAGFASGLFATGNALRAVLFRLVAVRGPCARLSSSTTPAPPTKPTTVKGVTSRLSSPVCWPRRMWTGRLPSTWRRWRVQRQMRRRQVVRRVQKRARTCSPLCLAQLLPLRSHLREATGAAAQVPRKHKDHRCHQGHNHYKCMTLHDFNSGHGLEGPQDNQEAELPAKGNQRPGAGKVPEQVRTSESSKELKAQKVLDSKGAILKDQNLWQTRPKQRAVTTSAKALEDAAAKLIAFPEHDELMQHMLHLSDMGPKKFELFGILRANYIELVKSLPDADQDIMAWVSVETFESIVMTIAGMLLKDLEQVALPRSFLCPEFALSVTFRSLAVSAAGPRARTLDFEFGGDEAERGRRSLFVAVLPGRYQRPRQSQVRGADASAHPASVLRQAVAH